MYGIKLGTVDVSYGQSYMYAFCGNLFNKCEIRFWHNPQKKPTTTQHQYLIESMGKYFIKRRLTARLDLDTYSTCINAFIMVDSDGLLTTSVCLFINWALSHQEVCVMP